MAERVTEPVMGLFDIDRFKESNAFCRRDEGCKRDGLIHRLDKVGASSCKSFDALIHDADILTRGDARQPKEPQFWMLLGVLFRIFNRFSIDGCVDKL